MPSSVAGNDGERLLRSESAGLHGLAEVHAIDVLHDQVKKPARLAVLEDAYDVRVLEFSQRAGLAGEALGEGRIAAEGGIEDLEGDGAVERRLADSIDETHAAAADEPEDLPLRKSGGDFLDLRRAEVRCGFFLGIAQHASRAEGAGGVFRDGRVAGGAGFRVHTGFLTESGGEVTGNRMAGEPRRSREQIPSAAASNICRQQDS